jgi:hypothetical protein
MTEPIRVLSLGAGVQSTALLMLILNGEVECDAAVFADTGWEPAAVYEHLGRLRTLAADRGFPVYVVQAGDIRDTERQKAFYDAPYFLLQPDGTEGMARRQCTHQLKLLPIRRKVREVMAERGVGVEPGAVEQFIGISLDEVQRMKPSDVRYIVNRWPLIERGWTRHDCVLYLREHTISAPRSACIGCPYHSDTEWRDMKRDRPGEFADAVQFEREIQVTEAGRRGTPFLHAQRVPLDLVDLASREDRGQLNFDAECEGMCGV